MIWKVLLTAAIIYLAWMIFKRANQPGRPGVGGGESRTDRIRRAAEDAVKARTGRREPVKAVDLVQCPSCGNYVAPGSTCNCGWKSKA